MDMKKNLIITGLPRSGTSFLCSKLNSITNTVVLNEPVEIPQAFRSNNLKAFEKIFDNYRSAICNKIPILNKIKDGKFIEDTNEVDERNAYIPDISSNDFVLGVKNTLVILSNLHRIKKETTIVANVRHPLDTIGSWSNVSFTHMNNGQPKFLIDMVDNKTKRILVQIMNQSTVIKRQALLWTFLARQVIKHNELLHLIQYENLIENTVATLEPICLALKINNLNAELLHPSTLRRRRSLLSKKETEIVQRICGKTALELGYTF